MRLTRRWINAPHYVKKFCGLIFAVVALLGVAAAMLNSSSVQNRMMGYTTSLLQDKLNTQVRIDSVHVNFLTQKIVLTGLDVEDQQQREMLRLDSFSARFSLWDLLYRKIMISNAEVKGVHARLYKEEGQPANYQFIIDAFKKDQPDKAARDSTKGDRFQLNIKDVRLADVDVHYHKDNHLPRKNKGKPNRGYFDAGHLDVVANLQVTIDHIEKDSIHAELTQGSITDSVAGINLNDLRFKVGINQQAVHLADVTIQQNSTILQFADGELRMPSQKTGAKLAYSTSEIKGRVMLKDISRPFAPVLEHFVMPLNLSVKLNGTDSAMTFKDIKVTTDDQRLSIAANGDIKHLTDKEKLVVRFHVNNMTAKGNIKREIINQFVVKKFMMKQLDALGTISYRGDVAILRRQEKFNGLLRTAAGAMNVTVALNEATKYISGSVRTSNFQLGKVLDMPDIGKIVCEANFKFDYSIPRTKKMRRLYGGKLPIGSVEANVSEAHYKGISVKHVLATVESNGAKALGNVTQKNKFVDIHCAFTFDDTDAMHKMKIKPGVKINAFKKHKKQSE